jgi:hypothetical protein
MRFTKRGWTLLVVGFSVAIATPSGAKPGEPGEPAHGEGKGEHERRDHDRDDPRHGEKSKDDGGKREHGRSDDDRDAAKGGDDEKSAAERREFQHGLYERREKAIVEQLNRDRKEMTDDVREAIRLHWRHLARLVRIRELAIAAKEDAFIKRVESDIEREEKAFTTHLEKLRGKGAAEGGAR